MINFLLVLVLGASPMIKTIPNSTLEIKDSALPIQSEYFDAIIIVPTNNIPNAAFLDKWNTSMKDKTSLNALKEAMKAFKDLKANDLKSGITDGLSWNSYKGAAGEKSTIRIVTDKAEKARNVKYVVDDLQNQKLLKNITVKIFSGKTDAKKNQEIQYVIIRTRKNDLNLRKGPSIKSAELCNMPKGARGIYKGSSPKEDIVDGKVGHWIQVEFFDVDSNKEYVGWAWGHYLQLDK